MEKHVELVNGKVWQAASDLEVMGRQASIADLPFIMQVEESWHEQGRAEEHKFISRLKRFPQGCFIAFDQSKGRPVATITACPVHYDPASLENYKDWETATNGGYFAEGLTPENPLAQGQNALYIASGVIDNDYRGADIFAPMVGMVVEAAARLGVDFVLAGAVIPGYKRFCEKHGPVPAADYVAMRKGSSLVDPLLSMYEKIGFHVPDGRHVLKEYFPDDASLNHAALVVHRVAGVSSTGR